MQLIKREITQEFLDMARSYPVVTILGPRQSGKTTLTKQLFPNKPYVNLENSDERSEARKDHRKFLAQFPNGAILDEIQNEPELLSYIQGIVDDKAIKGMFIITGSHQLGAHGAVTQSLAGRTAMLKLLPLSIAELSNNDLNFSLDEYLLNGGYPRLYKDQLNPTKFYRDYVQTYVERDVRQIVNVKNLTSFQHFLKLCAGRTGQIFNSEALSNAIGVSYHTIKEWLLILEASFLVFRLQPYYENLGKRIIKAPKIYFTDVGVATYLMGISSVDQLDRDPLRGHLVENLAIVECMKNRFNRGIEPTFYYYRDSNGNEVDLLFKSAHELIPIEIKSSSTFNPDFLKNLNYFKELAGTRCPKEFLIYSGKQGPGIGSAEIINYKNVAKIFEQFDPQTPGHPQTLTTQ